MHVRATGSPAAPGSGKGRLASTEGCRERSRPDEARREAAVQRPSKVDRPTRAGRPKCLEDGEHTPDAPTYTPLCVHPKLATTHDTQAIVGRREKLLGSRWPNK